MGLRFVGNYFWSDYWPPTEDNGNSRKNKHESFVWSTGDVSGALIEKRKYSKFENNAS